MSQNRKLEKKRNKLHRIFEAPNEDKKMLMQSNNSHTFSPCKSRRKAITQKVQANQGKVMNIGRHALFSKRKRNHIKKNELKKKSFNSAKSQPCKQNKNNSYRKKIKENKNF